MTPALQTAAADDHSGKLQLDDLGYLFQQRPFSLDRITEPGLGDLDVPEIHDTQFQKLKAKAKESLQTGQPIGLVLWGEAGIGKSHLLARLFDWARKEGACCILLQNINAAASQLVSSIQKSVISQLTGGRQDKFCTTTLYAWLHTAIRRHLCDGEARAASAFKRIAENAFARHPAHAYLDKDVFKALYKFFVATHEAKRSGADERNAQLAVQWLMGDRLEPEECEILGVQPPSQAEESEEADDNQATRLLVVLGEVAKAADRPFLLCFDQVDVLSDEKMTRLCNFLHVLLDASTNLLAITCGVQQTLIEMKDRRIFTQATWDRIGQGNSITLFSIDRNQARKLLEVRMQRFVEQLRQFPTAWTEVQTDGLFPLGSKWFAERFAEAPDYRPRKVVHLARERWEEQERRLAELGTHQWLKTWESIVPTTSTTSLTPQEIEAIVDVKIDRKIQEQIATHNLNHGLIAPDANNYVGLIDALLRQCLDRTETYLLRDIETPAITRHGPKPTHQRIIVKDGPGQGTKERIGLTVVTTDNATSAAGYLRRLRDAPRPPEYSLLVTDQRKPLRLGAVGKGHFAELQRAGSWPVFSSLTLSFAEIAQLDALQAVVAQGKAGDIEIDLPDGTTLSVGEKEVIASHHRQNRYKACPLLERFLGTGHVPPPPPPQKIDAQAVTEFVMAQLALTIGMSTRGLALKFASAHSVPLEKHSALHAAFVDVATRLHEDNRVNATPTEDGLFLLLK